MIWSIDFKIYSSFKERLKSVAKIHNAKWISGSDVMCILSLKAVSYPWYILALKSLTVSSALRLITKLQGGPERSRQYF